MKNLIRLSCLFLAASTAFAANALSVLPSSTVYSSTGSSVTITVNLNYSEVLSALDFELTTPADGGGWKVSTVTGTNVPQTIPESSDLGAGGLGFVYTDIPPGSASFVFVLAYPAGMSGKKELSYTAHFADEAGKVSAITGRLILTPDGVVLREARPAGAKRKSASS